MNATRIPDFRKVKHEVRRAPKNKLIIYHRGYLYIDRQTNEDLHDAAKYLLEQAEQGTLELFQKRIGYWDYIYLFRVR